MHCNLGIAICALKKGMAALTGVHGPHGRLPAIRSAVDGMADAWTTFTEFKASQLDSGKVISADGFGTRELLKNDYLIGGGGAVGGYGGGGGVDALTLSALLGCLIVALRRYAASPYRLVNLQ